MDSLSPESNVVARQAPPRKLLIAVLTATCLSGAAALIYEVAWTRELSLVFGSTVYAVSAMLAAFMAGLAVGGFLGGRRADMPGANMVRDLALLEIGIGIFGVLTIPLIRSLPAVYFWLSNVFATPGWTFFMLQLLLSFLVMLVPTTLMGATFPIVAKICTHSYGLMGHSVGRVYSINTLGSVAGSIAAGFILIPLVGVRATIITAAVLNLAIGAGLLVVSRAVGRGRAVAVGAGLLAFAVGVTALVPDPAFTAGFTMLDRFGSYSRYSMAEKDATVLFRDDGVHSRVTVTRDSFGGISLYSGSFIEGSSQKGDLATTSILAALPYANADDPKSALIVGLGTGYTASAMLRFPLDRVETVEINPAVRDASRYFVGSELEDDPRWKLAIGDARQYLEATDSKYDIVSSEPSWPISESVAHLFTLEFFEIVESRLNDGGVFTQWLPRYLLEREDFMMVYRTFHSVFPNASVWVTTVDGEESSDLFLVGVKSSEQMTAAEVRERVITQLEEWGLDDVDIQEMDSPVTLEEAVTSPDVPLNTDDRSLLEFRAVRNLVNNIVRQLRASEP